jgi:transcriptional regulator with XRE-family HTH domain
MGAEWFAGRLRELRERAGLTQQQLARKAGLDKDSVSRLERARWQPTWETVVALAGALGVDCTAFLQPPTEQPPARPGRPRKTPATPATPADAAPAVGVAPRQPAAGTGQGKAKGKTRERKGG